MRHGKTYTEMKDVMACNNLRKTGATIGLALLLSVFIAFTSGTANGANVNTAYTYDSLNRLTKVDYYGSGKSIAYTYDATGNKTAVVSGAAPSNCPATVSPDLIVYMPMVTFGSYNFWLYLTYNAADSALALTNYNLISNAAQYSSCTASTLSSDLKLHIPVLMLGSVSYWVDLQWNGSAFAITGAGAN